MDKKRILGLCLFLLGSLTLMAQTPTLKAQLDSSSYWIGDHILCKVSIETKKGNSIYFETLTDTIDGRIELLSVSEIDSTPSSLPEMQQLSKTFVFTVFEAGLYRLPPIPVYLMQSGSSLIDTLYTQEIDFEVLAPEVSEESDLKDIKTIWKAPLTFREILPYALAALLLILVALAGWYIYKRHQAKRPLFSAPKKPQVPAHIEALQRLEELRQAQLPQKGEVKRYYTQLTDILRTYLERRMQIAAAEMTSDELIEALQSQGELGQSAWFDALKGALTTADLVKFAKAMPLNEEHDFCFRTVVQIVEATRPKEEVNA